MKKKALLLSLALLVLAGIGGFVFYPRHPSQFCWLVFGSDPQVRVLVRLDGTTVSLEQHRDGAAVQQVAHFDRLEDFQPVEIRSAEGRTAILSGITDLDVASPAKLLEFTVQVKAPTSEYRQAGWVWMTSDREKAPIVPFDGSLNVSPEMRGNQRRSLRRQLPFPLRRSRRECLNAVEGIPIRCDAFVLSLSLTSQRGAGTIRIDCQNRAGGHRMPSSIAKGGTPCDLQQRRFVCEPTPKDWWIAWSACA